MSMTEDPFDLERFVEAQEGVYPRVCGELRAGHKRSHWMWFIFPQVRGLGASPTAQRFGISCADEARAYLRHSILGARLRECTQLVLDIQGRSAHEIFGSPDELKFRSCMTLFARTSAEALFPSALQKYFAGEADSLTLERLEAR
jgi:uncharacterized protein (DUF1810 family)